MLYRTALYNATRLSNHSIAHNIFYHVREHSKGIILIPKTLFPNVYLNETKWCDINISPCNTESRE